MRIIFALFYFVYVAVIYIYSDQLNYMYNFNNNIRVNIFDDYLLNKI